MDWNSDYDLNCVSFIGRSMVWQLWLKHIIQYKIWFRVILVT